MKLPIRDLLFSHAFSSSNWFKPTYFEWDFTGPPGEFMFFTDRNMREAAYYQCKKYAWLVESPAVIPEAYDFVSKNLSLFDKIFTFSEKLLQNDNTYLLPIGGCHLKEENIRLDHEKTKLISMMYSFKRFAPGHELRHEIANNLSTKVDIMGSGKGGPHVQKDLSCLDYKFQIVIENIKESHYFTEKIIDCFLSGVIPIYWGCPSIDQFFNPNGMLTFNNLDHLRGILSSDLDKFYDSRRAEIEENYKKALDFKIAEDYLWTNYKEIL